MEELNEEQEELTYDQKLVRLVEETFRSFMEFPDDHSYTAATLWVLHTHLRALSGEFLPYVSGRLVFLSDGAGAGKTLATELATRMSYNGKMSLEQTPYGLISMLNIDRATIGIDEMDLLLGQGRGNTTTRAILNSGYKKGAEVVRQRGDETDSQNIHGPLVLNGKNRKRFMLHENFETLRSRSIPITLTQKKPGTKLQRWKPAVHERRIHKIMLELREWGMAAARHVLAIDVDDIIPDEIDNRDREIWEVLFQLAEFLGGDWPERCHKASLAIVLGIRPLAKEERVDPFDQLLANVRAVFESNEEFVSTLDILDRLARLEEPTILREEWVSIKAGAMGLARGLGVHNIKKVRVQHDGDQEWGYTRRSLGLPDVKVEDDLDEDEWDEQEAA